MTLDKYDIFEADRHRTVYNWLQRYDVRALGDELRSHGFELTPLLADLTGARFEPDGTDFAVISTVRA